MRAGSRVSYVPAAALVGRTDALRAAGGFDEALRFGEDVDLVWRLDEAGQRVRYEPASEVHHAPRRDWRAWWRQRQSYGRSAAPLAERHDGALAPVRASGWSVLAWGVGTGVSPVAGLTIGAGTVVALARKLRALDHPWQESLRLAGLGNLFAGRLLATAITRAWWPIAVVLALVSRRARRILLAAALIPPLVDWVRDRPPLDPMRATAARIADDVAYGTGVWQGVLSERIVDPLVPDLTSWPNPPRRQRGRRVRRVCALRSNSSTRCAQSRTGSPAIRSGDVALALGRLVGQQAFDLGSECGTDLGIILFEPPHVAVHDRDQSHRRASDDARRSSTSGQDGDLTEHIARTEGADHAIAVEDLGRALTHREHRVAEVALVDEGLVGLDLHLVARLGELLALVRLEVGEEWDLDEVGGIHAGERNTGPVTPSWPVGDAPVDDG